MDMDKKFLLLMCMILLIGSAMPLVSSAPPTVTLISPEDEAEAFIREPIWFNATATATIGIKNISLYGNFSGTWLLNKTTNFNSTSPINYPHLTGTQGSSGASSNPVGYNINMTSEGYLASVQKVTTTTSTYAYVYFLNNTLIQKSNAFSGDWATFTPEVHLINGGKYRVRVAAEGGAFNSGFSGEIMPYPAYRTFFLYDFGNYWYEDTSPNRERWIGIQSINMTNSTSVSLPTYYAENFTATIGGTTLWNVEACNSNGMCNFAENNWTAALPF